MATYAAVASLLQTLDYLQQFPDFILEVQKIQADILTPKLDELLLLLRGDQPSTVSSLLQLIEKTDSFLARSVEGFFKTVMKGSDAGDVFIAIKQRMLSFTSSTTTSITFVEGKPQMVEEIRFFEKKLRNVLHSIDRILPPSVPVCGSDLSLSIDRILPPPVPVCGSFISGKRERLPVSITESSHSSTTKVEEKNVQKGKSTIQHSSGTVYTPDLEQQLFLLYYHQYLPIIIFKIKCRELYTTISSFSKATMEIRVLRQHLLSLLNLLKEDPSNKKCCHDHELLKQVKDVADRVRDLVEEQIADSKIDSAMKYAIWSLGGYGRPLPIPFFIGCLEHALKKIFNGERNDQRLKPRIIIGQRLEQASEEIQLLNETIARINEETPRLQTSISSISLRYSNREDIVVGLDDELISLLEGLTRFLSGLEIVTILGMGGIGKTTLARKAFQHSYTAYHFYCRAWITVSQVYQVRDLLLDLLGALALSTDKMVEKNNAQLGEALWRSLKGKRYLIVVDDMWSIEAWNDIKRCFPDDKNGSRIVVTSRITKLAVYINPKETHRMNLLDIEKSWQLLHKLVFGIESCPPELEKIGKHIAKGCQGLPLAIVVIAGVLSRVIRMYDCWNDIAEKVSSFVSTNPEECLDILALSYNYLPHHLKACFLYMAAFPEDCEIQVQKLINLWVAEGFLDPQSSKDLEQIAEEYLQDLIDRNLVMIENKYFGGKVKTCRLHDFLRELCLREAEKENFIHVIQKRGAKCTSASLRNQRRLSFHLDPYCDVSEPPPIPHISSFLCFTLGTDIVPNILFFQLGFKILRVLDIFFLNFEYFPEQILNLIHLRYLALNVTYELPASVSELSNLQTLVIHGPWHRRESNSSPTFLVEYWRMPSLRHLHCTVTIHLKNPPGAKNELPQLFVPEYLQTLSTVRFSNCTQEVFSIMPHLKKLGICETEEDYSKDGPSEFLKNLHCLTELETLDCCFYKQNCEARRISCLSAFPCTLRELSLSWSYLPWEDMSSIAMLPRLEVLKLKNFAFQGPKWEPVEDGFCSLKHLLIEKTDLVHWKATIHHFPCLQHLVLKSCKLLEEVPFGVEEIGTLLRIELQYCSEPTEVAAREIQEQIEGIEVVIRSD